MIVSSLAAVAALLAGQETFSMSVPEEMAQLIQEAYAAESAQIAAFDCADEDRACLAEELIERFRVDQWARVQARSLEICGTFAQTHPQQCSMQILVVAAFEGDVPNLARLKAIMEIHGWPSPPEFPAEAQRAAWYIAQHGQFLDETETTRGDADFAESILPNVRAAVEAEELTPWAYAAMFDRIRRTRGEPQRYATQIMCADGRAEFGELELAEDVDRFRAEIGMAAFDQAAYDAHCSGG